MTAVTMLLSLGLAYLVGAIPFAWLAARTRGVDIRTVGSGNVGATNVFRSISRPLGVLVFTLDALKGFAPARWGRLWPMAGAAPDEARTAAWALALGAAAVIGHTWPVWLKFKGGKGVATSTGVVLAVAPPIAMIALAAWCAMALLFRYVSLASIVAALAAAAASWWWYPAADPRPAVFTALAGLIILRHRANLQRLRAGTEPRIGAKAPPEKDRSP